MGDFIKEMRAYTTPVEIPHVVKIRPHHPVAKKIHFHSKGDWFDLYAAEEIQLWPFRFAIISLGFSVELPKGYEMHIVPRSSTFKRWRILQTNHMGVIDNSYCGDNDIVKFPLLSFGFKKIKVGDRICQAKIVKKQPPWAFIFVDKLHNKDRGGLGSTGR